MTNLVYNPYTIEIENCTDCCPDFPVVDCDDLFPNGIAQYWEFTIPDQVTTAQEAGCHLPLVNTGNCLSCHCSSFEGIWQLQVADRVNAPICGGGLCGLAGFPRTSNDVIHATCNVSGQGSWTFSGWYLCLITQAINNYSPIIPANSIVLRGAISNTGTVLWGVIWYIALSSFNPLNTNVLTRSLLSPGNTMSGSFCTLLPPTITIEPVT